MGCPCPGSFYQVGACPIPAGPKQRRRRRPRITDLDTLSQALCEPIDGVLGLEYPRGFAYEIDYLHSTLRLAAALDQLPPRMGGWQFPHLVTITSGPQPLNEFIELATAAPDALALDEAYAGLDARLDALGVPREKVVDSTHGPRFAWPDLTVAGLDLRGVDAHIDREIFQAYLGAKIRTCSP